MSLHQDMPPWPFVPSGITVEIARAEGCFLYTKDGHAILDAAGGAIVANIGHGRAEVADAVAASMRQQNYVVPPFATDDRLGLVERLQKNWLPDHLPRVHLSSGGSEAVDVALRLARLYHVNRGEPGRYKMIGRDISYHGTTVATLAVGGHESRRKGLEAMWTQTPLAPTPYPLRHHERGGGDCGDACAQALEDIILAEGPETVAAFIAEPIIGSSGGAIVPPDNYWPKVEEICRRHGVLIIADEVMTGFGRTGTRFAFEHWNVKADIMVSGKGLTAGYAPLVGVYATQDMVDVFAEKNQALMFYTYGGHSAACAASNAVLDIMEREQLVERVQKMERVVEERFRPLSQHPHVAEVRGRGLLWSVEVVKDRDTLEPFAVEDNITNKIVGAGMANGAFFYPGGTGPVRDIITLGPPYVITDGEVDQMVSILEKSIDAAVARAH